MPGLERLKAHQEEPQCAQCRRKIDPIGFDFENFDAAVRWRTEEPHYKTGWVIANGPHGKVVAKTFPIDPAGALHNGPEFKDFFQLRDALATHGDDFLRGLIENLFAYGLGRRVSFADVETLDRLLRATKDANGALASLVENIVLCEEFRTR